MGSAFWRRRASRRRAFCCTVSTSTREELERWVERDCFIAFGGPLTFKKADYVRDAAARVPLDHLLTETDSPYMTPEPLRGTVCEPAHVIWTAEKLAEVLGCEDHDKRVMLGKTYRNALGSARSGSDAVAS